MLILLLGPDDFSKKEYVSGLAAKQKAELEFFYDGENLPEIGELTQQNLFAKPKVSVLVGLVGKYNDPKTIEKLVQSKNTVVFVEEKLDKRNANNKQLAASSKIEIKNFSLPHGKELNKWIESRVKFLDGSIFPQAVEELAVRLGRDEAKEIKAGGKVIDVQEVYNLWQADSEIQKLLAFVPDQKITPEAVKELVAENGGVDTLSIVNAIADNKKLEAFGLLHSFLATENASDEKGGIIQLNALLSEQFRNVAIAQGFLQQCLPEAEILDKTGWKPGRLFVLKKIAAKFQPKKVLDFLNKLDHLDEELKTSSTPPKVLLDMIVAQLFT